LIIVTIEDGSSERARVSKSPQSNGSGWPLETPSAKLKAVAAVPMFVTNDLAPTLPVCAGVVSVKAPPIAMPLYNE
jgi:hypothetical protein